MILAIFQGERVYEGNVNFLHAVYPMPTISRAVLDQATQAEHQTLGEMHPAMPLLFREDTFDLTSRLRRGRFYRAHGQRPYNPQRVNHYPYAPPTGGIPLDYLMDTYEPLQPPNPARGSALPLILLGDTGHKTAWRIVGSERLFIGETLFTLKSANTMGILPELILDALPEEKREQVAQAYEKVADAAYTYLPESVVDICREFVRTMLAGWLPTIGQEPKGDLGDLIRLVPADHVVLKSAAAIVGRLHARGKSSEKERQAGKGRELRAVSREDGDLAIGLVACLLREFGWGI